MEAEDIAIETFQKMSRNTAGKNTYGDFRAAIFTAVRYRSINFYNRRKNRVVPLDELPQYEPSEDSVTIWMLTDDVIKTIIEELDSFEKEEDKLLAEYLIFRELSPKEVAVLLGMREQTVRNKRSAIYKRFKNALKRKDLPIFILLF
jgi:RNA polymerase sigma factor (sigma-70 family)